MLNLPPIPRRPRGWAAALGGALLAAGTGPGALAQATGSATAESIWDRGDALQQARGQVPAGAVITRERCLEIEVGMSPRYRCSVEWQRHPPQPSEAGADPADGPPTGR